MRAPREVSIPVVLRLLFPVLASGRGSPYHSPMPDRIFARILVALCILSAFVTCSPAGQNATGTSEFARPIEVAQGRTAWRGHRAFASEVRVQFGGKTILEGTMTFNTAVNLARMDLDNGSTLVFDGRTAWQSPPDSPQTRGRFHVLTWPYFLAAPFKLSDPGARIAEREELQLDGITYDTALLSFDPGTGDTPEDWYRLFRDRQTNRLAAMGYIVTYGKDADEAKKKPSVIVYGDFTTIQGVTIPIVWDLYYWEPDRGRDAEAKARVVLSAPRFVEPGPDFFTKPDDARELPLPPNPGK